MIGHVQVQHSAAPHSSLALPTGMMGAMPQRVSRPPLAPITSNENAQLATPQDEVSFAESSDPTIPLDSVPAWWREDHVMVLSRSLQARLCIS